MHFYVFSLSQICAKIKLKLLQQKLENMEHNEENERLLDKTEAAFKEIPGLTEEYFTRKRAAIEESRPQPSPKRRKVAKKRGRDVQDREISQNQTVEYYISPEEQIQAVEHITLYEGSGYQITYE